MRFLPSRSRLLVAACRFAAVRDLVLQASEQHTPGIWGSVLCRKRYADDQVSAALAAGIRQVVFLGTGLDTKAYRLVAPAGATAYEVDMPANITYKRARLHAIYGRLPDHVVLLAEDLETGDVLATLATHGFQSEMPTLFVWEAVTPYLTAEGMHRTLGALSKAVTGSRLIFTYLRQDFLSGTNIQGAERLYQTYVRTHPIWKLGLAPEDVAGLLGQYGWVEREQVGRAEYLRRYVEPTGRDLAVYDIERFVSAEKV
jgi:methyltransferase (TIGR00027 family)